MDASVPLAPPAVNAALISSLSMMLMILGVVLVLCALPPVRAAAGELADRVASIGKPRRNVVAAEGASEQQAPSRREIEEFDLDLFS